MASRPVFDLSKSSRKVTGFCYGYQIDSHMQYNANWTGHPHPPRELNQINPPNFPLAVKHWSKPRW